MCFYDKLYTNHSKKSIQTKYKSHICIYYTIFSINYIILIIDSKRIVSRSSYYHLNYIIEKSLHLFLFYSFLILYNHPNLTIKYNSSYFNTYQILYSKFYFLYENIFILSYNLSFLCVHLMCV